MFDRRRYSIQTSINTNSSATNFLFSAVGINLHRVFETLLPITEFLNTTQGCLFTTLSRSLFVSFSTPHSIISTSFF